jgi:hypothetical protein
MSEPAPIPNSQKEKTEYIKMAYEKYTTGEYAREHFVQWKDAGPLLVLFHVKTVFLPKAEEEIRIPVFCTSVSGNQRTQNISCCLVHPT